MSQVDTIALVIAPDRQHHVRHHHHQRSPLSKLLIQAENDAQHRNGDQATTDAEQTAQGSQTQAQQQIQQQVEQIHDTSRQWAHVNQSRLARKRIATHNGFAYLA